MAGPGGPAGPGGTGGASGRWRPPLLWRAAQLAARGLVAALARLRVTGDVPARRWPDRSAPGPLILAANHISPFDPIALTAACRRCRIAPRFLAAAELFAHRVLGPVMRHWGHIPVHRGTPTATRALPEAAAALATGSVVVLYPEGGIGLDPGLWPQRGRSGVGRLALVTGAPVVPVALWGAHEVVPYTAPRGLLRALPSTIRRRPVVRVRFGAPVDLSGLRPDRPGDARRATDRIVAAITAQLAPLRVNEPDRPRHLDPTRPSRPSRAARAVPSGPDPLAQE
ncbi:MAG: 1-acyl-sn-glycerol-3-phosphate acyltransferase [Micromonosporaceae bacterium]|nr:1-acyl-sn-glycerol-3-phosphate acyltransferase [Micromonosporaceae bacterium]